MSNFHLQQIGYSVDSRKLKMKITLELYQKPMQIQSGWKLNEKYNCMLKVERHTQTT